MKFWKGGRALIKTDVKIKIGYSVCDLKSAVCAKLPIALDELSEIRVLRQRLNLSDKADIHYDLTVGISLSEDRERSLLKMRKKVSEANDLTFTVQKSTLGSRPVVVGAGPAGLFAALVLAESGARPIVYERGLSADDRIKKVELFKRFGILDPECNIQFGEGGAGTFSDGKLKYGSPDKYKMKVLREFVAVGAPEEITYSTSAHLGTDLLPRIVKGLREKIISLGGEVHFSARLTDIKVSNGRVVGGTVVTEGREEHFECEHLILAAGHSAEDVFALLKSKGAALEARGFGIGVRIEHKREYINKLMYGEDPPEGLGAASYHLVTHLGSGRSVYSFCMCPGGSVVSAASEPCGIVTNGMSEFRRDGENSNAAILVSVTPDDFPSDDPLAGIALQRSIEKRAYSISSDYRAPVQMLKDFMEDRKSTAFGEVEPSYRPGVVLEKLSSALPDYITDSMREGFLDFDAWLPGYMKSDATLTAPETRSTSPVRVLRGDDFEACLLSGLYPIGEGAGYAGGIVSSARDGVICAEKILEKAQKCK